MFPARVYPRGEPAQATAFSGRPAPGYRNPNSGELVNVGSNGNYWSGTPSGTNGYGFNFNPTDVNPSNAGCNRADARLVRCLQASAPMPGSFFEENSCPPGLFSGDAQVSRKCLPNRKASETHACKFPHQWTTRMLPQGRVPPGMLAGLYLPERCCRTSDPNVNRTNIGSILFDLAPPDRLRRWAQRSATQQGRNSRPYRFVGLNTIRGLSVFAGHFFGCPRPF